MKLPEPAPDWLKHRDKGVALLGKPQINELINKANRTCLYWDKFKYLPFPEGTNKEHAWAALKISRGLLQRKNIPLQDVSGVTFNYWLSDYAHGLLHKIDTNSRRDLLAGAVDMSEEKRRYVKQLIMEEAITSSQIEGAATTRVVAQEMLRSNRKPRDHSERMIYNNYQTINIIKDEYKDYPLSAELIKDIHKLISSETLEKSSEEGRFREGDDQVFVVSANDNAVLHTPSPANAIEGSINELCKYINSDQEEFVHPIIKGIVLHFWIAYLHPFMDGNGRVSRALFYWYMLRTNYESFEFIGISKYIKEKQTKYYWSFLCSEQDDSDLTYFIIYNLEALKTTIEDLKGYISKKQEKKAAINKLMAKHADLNYRQKQILAEAVDQPGKVFTIKGHQGIHNVVYQTARTDLMQLEEQGLLVGEKRGKKFEFMAPADLRDKIYS